MVQLHFPLPIESLHIEIILQNRENRQPTYTLGIDGNGNVLFNGEKHVRHIGQKSRVITKYEVLNILESFIDNEFFTLRSFYSHKTSYALVENTILTHTDILPESENFKAITLKTQTDMKTVKNYSGAPNRFSCLLEDILTLSGAKSWI